MYRMVHTNGSSYPVLRTYSSMGSLASPELNPDMMLNNCQAIFLASRTLSMLAWPWGYFGNSLSILVLSAFIIPFRIWLLVGALLSLLSCQYFANQPILSSLKRRGLFSRPFFLFTGLTGWVYLLKIDFGLYLLCWSGFSHLSVS